MFSSNFTFNALNLFPDDAIASYIISKKGGVSAMKLQKLVYYVEAYHLAVTGFSLVKKDFKAWKQGPVLPELWHNYKNGSISTDIEIKDNKVIELINEVLAEFGSLNGDELSELTHKEKPWLIARGDLSENEKSDKPIDKEIMRQYFRQQLVKSGNDFNRKLKHKMLEEMENKLIEDFKETWKTLAQWR